VHGWWLHRGVHLEGHQRKGKWPISVVMISMQDLWPIQLLHSCINLKSIHCYNVHHRICLLKFFCCSLDMFNFFKST
jgi:hypothetical protein